MLITKRGIVYIVLFIHVTSFDLKIIKGEYTCFIKGEEGVKTFNLEEK